MKENSIKWSSESIQQFNAAIDYIARDSFVNAESVQDKILLKLEKVLMHPNSCPPDKYRKINDGSFRAFTIFRYRISYRISQTGIEILRIRHSSMRPKHY